jgi:hypothetical protein
MGRIATAIMLLTALAAPAFAAQQLTDFAPLLARPHLDFDPTPDTGWVAESWKPELFAIGLTRTAAGALEPEVPVVMQRGASGLETGGVSRQIPVDDFRGQRIRLSARLKSQDAGRLQMWLRTTAYGPLSYDMSDRPISGTTDWRRYEIVMDVPYNATSLSYGFFLAGRISLFGPRDGKGIAWGDSFAIEIVSKDVPVSAAYLAADHVRPAPVRAATYQRGTCSFWSCAFRSMYGFDVLGRAPRK